MPRQLLLFCLCWQLSCRAWAHSPAPVIVHTELEFKAALASNAATPLDALTPFGKREAIRQMSWHDGRLVSFGFTSFIRELDHEQLAAVLQFIDAGTYLSMLDRNLVGAPLRLPDPSPSLEDDLQLLRQFTEEDNARRARANGTMTKIGAPEVIRRYRELFGRRMSAASLSTETLGDLVPLFDAASLAVNGNPTSAALDDMERVHRELTTRGIDTRRVLDGTLMDSMLAARRFEQARAFAINKPGLAKYEVPRIVDELGADFKGRSAFEYDAARNTLTRMDLTPPRGTQLVMVVGGACHNSENALHDIHADVALQGRLRQANLVLITAPNVRVDTSLIADWNRTNPSMPMRAPYNAEEWSGIEVTGIPAFYLLRDGKVVNQRAGWPEDGKAELLKLIDMAGQSAAQPRSK
jgi:hypothetical protein